MLGNMIDDLIIVVIYPFMWLFYKIMIWLFKKTGDDWNKTMIDAINEHDDLKPSIKNAAMAWHKFIYNQAR